MALRDPNEQASGSGRAGEQAAAAVFALNPAGYPDPDLAIAASRAGAVGILNAECGGAPAWVEPALRRLAQFGGPAIGLKIAGADAALIDVAARLGARLGYLIVDPAAMRACRPALAAYRAGGGRLGVEVIDWDDEIAGLCAIADLIWIKGHEAGGFVGEQTSFILIQKVADRTNLPFYVRGGINERSAAAATVGGAAGVVLDDQLLLLRESPLAAQLAPKLRRFTGIETILLEQYGAGPSLRIWPVPGRGEARALAAEHRLSDGAITGEQSARIGWPADPASTQIPPLGQDGVVAPVWAERYGTVPAALRGLTAAMAELPAKAAERRLCGADTPLALSHGTRYPIVQGPMTHVSDRVGFIEAVAAGGGLPMVAVSLMRGEPLLKLLRETRERLGDRPWGVGLLGFVPAEVLKEQRDAVRDTRPPFAVIAGGRPDQSRELEQAGVSTYLHVPSPALLAQFLEQGARHFIFEGRECGGHIGPLASFVLWGQMIDALVTCDLPDSERQKIHVLLAGGIHDARSSAMAAVMAEPLAACGIRSGVLMGTGYTFTKEAVTGTAITPEFQRIVIEAKATVGLVTGPGHASRCVYTPFAEAFWARGRELEKSGASAEEVRAELEDLSLGRLRLASKGVIRKRADQSGLREAPVEEQRDGGMYMIGQSAVLRDKAITVAELHREVGDDAEALLRERAGLRPAAPRPAALPPADIAIVGMSAIMPDARHLSDFWGNILNKVASVREIPADRWDWRLYFDADRTATDKIYSKWGGFMPDVTFDPMRFGMPPVSVRAIDPMQLLALVAVEEALADAGLQKADPRQREQTSVILGFSGGLGELGVQYATRAELVRAMGEAPPETLDFLPPWSTDSFAGLLPNVMAGRIANRFDFGGVNFVVDAACASSLSALRLAVIDLETKRSDVVVCGGVDTVQGPFGFMCFSKAGALSPNGRCRTFDAAADGTAISEGVAMVVLKRLADAERDGDRIYAVIKGVGGSSDGRGLGLMAPLPSGQKRALDRAYAQAGFSPATVEVFEAHGTGTVAGDAAELQSLSEFLVERGAKPKQSAVGSVKTMIGHTKASAGVAGLIKVALGLHHRVLPPHLGVEQPNPTLRHENSPVALHQEARPWLAHPGHPRRGGVSSFGFGGTNNHVVLEEYQREYRRSVRTAPRAEWPAELFVWRGADRAGVAAAASPVLAALEGGAMPPPAALAQALAAALPAGRATLAIVAGSLAELRERLTAALSLLGDPARTGPFPPGMYFSDAPLADGGQLAMLFSGQGSQYPDMLREIAVAFDEMREAMEEADAVLSVTPTYRDRDDPRLSRLIYPFDRFGDAEEKAARAALASTDVAQPALGAVGSGLFALARRLGLSPAMVGGHSYGEYVALHAAGVLSRRDLLLASEARGRFIVGAVQGGDLGTMAAVSAEVDAIRAALEDSDVVLANFNAPKQTIVSGATASVKQAIETLTAQGMSASPIPVAAAFHSPLMQPAAEPLRQFLGGLEWQAPSVPIYANTTAEPHAAEPDTIRDLLGRHLTEPVKFVGMIEAMYAAGARVFLEIGPKSVLADLARRILGDRPHRAVSLDGSGGGIAGLLHGLAALLADGVAVDLAPLFEGRVAAPIDLAKLPEIGASEPVDPNLWLVNGTRARRMGEVIRVSAERPAAPVRERIAPPAPPAAPHAVPGANRALYTKEVRMDGYDGPVPRSGGPDLSGPAAYTSPVGAERAMADYHQTMRQFLQVQERVMLSYLGAADTMPRPFATPQIAHAPRYAIPAPQPVIAPRVAAPVAPPVVTAAPAPVAVPSAPAAAPAKPAAPAVAAAPVAAAPVAAAPAPAPAAPAAAPAAPAADPKTMLLQIAADRTGYPEDMLGLDLNMEADLGIDSIKRVEILGAFRKALPASVGDALSGRMDDLSKAKTLQGILEIVASAGAVEGGVARPFDQAGKGLEQASAPLSRSSATNAPPLAAPLARYVIRAHAEPLPSGGAGMVPSGMYILVPDRVGVASALAARLELDGARVRIVPEPVMANEDALGKWLGTVRAEDRIRAVVDLRPVRRPDPADWSDLAAWGRAMSADVKDLFPILRLAAPDLTSGGMVMVGSGMGGLFARDVLTDPRRADLFPGSGGGVGLIKCMSFEWRECRCKAVDLDLDLTAEQLAEQLHGELAYPGGRREIGYPAGVRTVFRTEPGSLIPQATPLDAPDKSWVVLAIGGARGITAETLRPFAEAGATCVIVGRSAPPLPEDAALAALPDVAALRAHFLAQAKAAGETPRPAAIEARVNAALRDREIRANLDDFRAMGATLDLRACDVRNEADAGAMLDDIYARYGRLDAVLFGAGLIEDQLLVNKQRDSLSRVFDTKVDGAFVLASRLRPDSLKFVALFTSVAGRYGNPGQSDYGAANEVLNRYAWLLQAKWGSQVKVTAINWGPWANTTRGPGMLTPETARQFRARGISLIGPEEGRDFLFRELLYAPRDEVEVVAGEHPWEYREAEAARPASEPAPVADQPLLHTASIAAANGKGRKFRKSIDLVSDPYLDEHRLDGRPVLPFAVATEYMAEAASILAGAPVRALTGVRLLNGLVLRDRPIEIEITCQQTADGATAAMEIMEPGPRPRAAYRAAAEFGAAPAAAVGAALGDPVAPLPADMDGMYRSWLFHGPKFQTIRSVLSMGERRIVAHATASRPGDFYPPAQGQDWIFDPGLVDGAMQLVFAWSRRFRDGACLPTGIGRVSRFGDEPLHGDVTLFVSVGADETDSLIRWGFEAVDPEGRTRLMVEGGEAWIDPQLKRLGGGWAGGVPLAMGA